MTGGTHTATGSAVALSSFITAPAGERFKQIDIKNGSDSGAVAYVGGSTVTSAGANAWVALEAGATWGARADVGDRLNIDLSEIYVVGTASDLIHVSLV
jgi:predicted exporter